MDYLCIEAKYYSSLRKNMLKAITVWPMLRITFFTKLLQYYQNSFIAHDMCKHPQVKLRILYSFFILCTEYHIVSMQILPKLPSPHKL